MAMGVPPELGRGAVRLSVGRFTTEDEIDRGANDTFDQRGTSVQGQLDEIVSCE